MKGSISAYRIRVIGKVQGVWFRASTRRKAEELNISGFVRNEADGSVYIEAEGPVAKMDAFVKWCHEGPVYAKVLAVHPEPIDEQNFDGFEVLR